MANTGGFGTTGYNPAKPWDYLWRLASDRNQTQESAWWYREFERKIPIVLKKRWKFLRHERTFYEKAEKGMNSTHNFRFRDS